MERLSAQLFFLFGVFASGGCAGGWAVLLPEIAALQSTASGDFNFPTTLEIYFPIFDMIARHIGNVQGGDGTRPLAEPLLRRGSLHFHGVVFF